MAILKEEKKNYRNCGIEVKFCVVVNLPIQMINVAVLLEQLRKPVRKEAASPVLTVSVGVSIGDREIQFRGSVTGAIAGIFVTSTLNESLY